MFGSIGPNFDDKSFNGNLWQQVRMPGHLVGWPAYGTTDQRGGWPSVARLTWDQRGGAGDWGMVSNGGSHEVSRWHQTSCQQRRRCPQLKSLRCSSTMFTRVHGLSYRGKNRRAAGIESHKLLLGNDVLPETWAKNRESTGHKDGAVSTRCRVKKVIYNLIIQTRP